MPTWGWIAIAIAAVVVLAAIAWSAYSSRRRKGLQERFGEARVEMVTGFHGSGVDAIGELDQRSGALHDSVRWGWGSLGYVLRWRRILGEGHHAEQNYGQCGEA